ncbi:MAG: peptidoglycan bridge formation glycyltransferase FemA/FemB family protein [Candidatus Saccharimonas sp.]|jgi:lipid II:glycine glycyltransferase (peptidoglycan interpeptide bridge formation enzyme)|nr:peptidoglycan bridge formation glycyltransferase FemA/FemB family protein [Candidatus Saccharimonas sp.]
MNARFASTAEIARWDELITANPDGGNVFQSREMAETKRMNGWTPRYLIVDDIAITIIEKKVFAHGRYWYIPKGPGITEEQRAKSIRFFDALSDFATKQGDVFTIKIEPELLDTPDNTATLTKFIKTPAIQPNSSTVIIDLTPSLDEIITSLNQKGRHAIRRAQRDGVTAAPVELTEPNMRIMFDLLSDTAAGRFESSLRGYQYYSQFWQAFSKTGRGQLFFAYFDGKVVAAAYCMYLGQKGLYKDGASIRERTVYGASHLLQWEIMVWMKQHGVISYDLCGSPHSSAIDDPTHKFHGVGRFKTSFNKHVTDYVGCYDIVIDPTTYKRWQQFGQRLAISLSWRLKKRQWF